MFSYSLGSSEAINLIYDNVFLSLIFINTKDYWTESQIKLLILSFQISFKWVVYVIFI